MPSVPEGSEGRTYANGRLRAAGDRAAALAPRTPGACRRSGRARRFGPGSAAAGPCASREEMRRARPRLMPRRAARESMSATPCAFTREGLRHRRRERTPAHGMRIGMRSQGGECWRAIT